MLTSFHASMRPVLRLPKYSVRSLTTQLNATIRQQTEGAGNCARDRSTTCGLLKCAFTRGVPKNRAILEASIARNAVFSSSGASRDVPIITIIVLKNRVHWKTTLIRSGRACRFAIANISFAARCPKLVSNLAVDIRLLAIVQLHIQGG